MGQITKASKYVECKNCKKAENCENTKNGGCFNGKEFTLDERAKFVAQIKCLDDFSLALAEFKKAFYKVVEEYRPDTKWRGVRDEFWREICKIHNEEKLINAGGDILFIDEKVDNCHWVGRRVLWNLQLSEEQYDIYEEELYDSDGDYDGVAYEVVVR